MTTFCCDVNIWVILAFNFVHCFEQNKFLTLHKEEDIYSPLYSTFLTLHKEEDIYFPLYFPPLAGLYVTLRLDNDEY